MNAIWLVWGVVAATGEVSLSAAPSWNVMFDGSATRHGGGVALQAAYGVSSDLEVGGQLRASRVPDRLLVNGNRTMRFDATPINAVATLGWVTRHNPVFRVTLGLGARVEPRTGVTAMNAGAFFARVQDDETAVGGVFTADLACLYRLSWFAGDGLSVGVAVGVEAPFGMRTETVSLSTRAVAGWTFFP